MENTIGLLGQNVVCCLYCSGLVAIFGIYCQTLVVMVNQALGPTSERGDESEKVKNKKKRQTSKEILAFAFTRYE